MELDVNGFLNGPGEAIFLPTYYVEVFHSGKVASGAWWPCIGKGTLSIYGMEF